MYHCSVIFQADESQETTNRFFSPTRTPKFTTDLKPAY
jgi:hypothetical protein